MRVIVQRGVLTLSLHLLNTILATTTPALLGCELLFLVLGHPRAAADGRAEHAEHLLLLQLARVGDGLTANSAEHLISTLLTAEELRLVTTEGLR